MTDRYTADEIWYETGALPPFIWEHSNDLFKSIVCRALAKIPSDVVDIVIGGCLFLMPDTAGEGQFVPRKCIKDKDLFVFPETLLGQDEETAHITVIHEVAHFVLDHIVPELEEDATHETDTNAIHDAQEKEAWDLVQKWLPAS